MYGPNPRFTADATRGRDQVEAAAALLADRVLALLAGAPFDPLADLRAFVAEYWPEPLVLEAAADGLRLRNPGAVSRYLSSLDLAIDGRPVDPASVSLVNDSPGEVGEPIRAADLGPESGMYIRRGQTARLEIDGRWPSGVRSVSLTVGLGGVTHDYARMGGDMTTDLLIRGGRVIDPANGLDGIADVAITDGRIAAVGPDLPGWRRHGHHRRDRPVRGPRAGRPSRPRLLGRRRPVHRARVRNDLARGATTIVDAGSAGANTFPGFRRYVIEPFEGRILAFLNISAMGQIDPFLGELHDLRYAVVEKAVEAGRAHPDLIVGLKIRTSEMLAGSNGLAGLDRALEAGRGARPADDGPHRRLDRPDRGDPGSARCRRHRHPRA